jgi:polysaccharide export outer membrane protein
VWPNNDLSGDFTVEESGLVYLPFLGEVQAAGVTLDDLRGRLREGYSQMIQNPVVTVSVVFNVGVLGAVSRPGVYQATTTTTLIDAIGMAGGFAPAADQERVRIVRDGRSIDVDAFRMLSTGQDVSALRLRSGDQVVVEGSRGGVDWRSILSIVQTVVTIAVLVDRVRN